MKENERAKSMIGSGKKKERKDRRTTCFRFGDTMYSLFRLHGRFLLFFCIFIGWCVVVMVIRAGDTRMIDLLE
jgi:hypothetical protein